MKGNIHYQDIHQDNHTHKKNNIHHQDIFVTSGLVLWNNQSYANIESLQAKMGELEFLVLNKNIDTGWV